LLLNSIIILVFSNCCQRLAAWRGCELRNLIFSVKDKISCET
jgi:hypothetical protein